VTENTLDLSGKSALVTGASRGIGRAVAKAFAAHGATVGVHYNSDEEAAENTAAELDGEDHWVMKADMSDTSAVIKLADEAITLLGGVDILVNNAGIFELHPVVVSETAVWLEKWQRTIDVNLLGPACLCHHLATHMAARGSGRIINITSRGAYRGEPQAPAYGAAKAGLNSLSQSLAQALAPHGVMVTAVAPGWVETDMTTKHLEGKGGEEIRAQSPLRRAATADEIADVVLFLAATNAEYMTGAVIDINGASYLR
jgi:NAD(P)-dependent dehydrogenase (short-subunit alcohol dehydrogenase family)